MTVIELRKAIRRLREVHKHKSRTRSRYSTEVRSIKMYVHIHININIIRKRGGEYLSCDKLGGHSSLNSIVVGTVKSLLWSFPNSLKQLVHNVSPFPSSLFFPSEKHTHIQTDTFGIPTITVIVVAVVYNIQQCSPLFRDALILNYYHPFHL